MPGTSGCIGGQGSGKRILIVSASMGGGHDGAAYELERQLRHRGYAPTVRDYLDALPLFVGHFVRWFYNRQLHVAPGSYDVLYKLTAHVGILRRISVWFACWACSTLLRWADGSDGIVVTYPLAGQAAARLRRRGLGIPVVVFLTDFSAHPLWVARGVDLHLVLHPVTAQQVRAVDPAARVQVSGAVVRGDFSPATPDDASALRRRYAIPPDAQVALLVSGSWGVGNVAAAAREVARTGGTVPIVVCGRNEALRRQLERERIGIPVGWVDDMASLMKGCDILVQNAGGLTSLEAMAVRLPVISYGCLPGHGRTNAEAMEQAGVALHACTELSLADLLGQLNSSHRRQLAARASELFATCPADALDSVFTLDTGRPTAIRPPRMVRRLVAATLSALVLVSLTPQPIGQQPRTWVSVVHKIGRLPHTVAGIRNALHHRHHPV